jgi:hypothetical protein
MAVTPLSDKCPENRKTLSFLHGLPLCLPIKAFEIQYCSKRSSFSQASSRQNIKNIFEVLIQVNDGLSFLNYKEGIYYSSFSTKGECKR